MKRTLVVVAVAGAVIAAVAWPASAKGKGPVGATISGPGIGGPGSGPGAPGGPGGGSGGSGGSAQGPGAAIGTIEVGSTRAFEPFQNNPLWRLASFTGISGGCGSCMSFIDTSPPKDRGASLGPSYVVTYFVGTCCAHSVRQMLYPFAPGGPWAHTLPHHGTRVWFVAQSHIAWWHTDGGMGQAFLRFLHHVGVPATNPVPAPVAPASAPDAASAASSAASNPAPWRLPVAIAVMALLLIAGAALARPRSSTRAA